MKMPKTNNPSGEIKVREIYWHDANYPDETNWVSKTDFETYKAEMENKIKEINEKAKVLAQMRVNNKLIHRKRNIDLQELKNCRDKIFKLNQQLAEKEKEIKTYKKTMTDYVKIKGLLQIKDKQHKDDLKKLADDIFELYLTELKRIKDIFIEEPERTIIQQLLFFTYKNKRFYLINKQNKKSKK